jgi:hypothetical protein
MSSAQTPALCFNYESFKMCAVTAIELILALHGPSNLGRNYTKL